MRLYVLRPRRNQGIKPRTVCGKQLARLALTQPASQALRA
jgi:hypothetical protein